MTTIIRSVFLSAAAHPERMRHGKQ